ncbi:hypothetical protein L9F63_003875, partial [Diploptera punctata]
MMYKDRLFFFSQRPLFRIERVLLIKYSVRQCVLFYEACVVNFGPGKALTKSCRSRDESSSSTSNSSFIPCSLVPPLHLFNILIFLHCLNWLNEDDVIEHESGDEADHLSESEHNSDTEQEATMSDEDYEDDAPLSQFVSYKETTLLLNIMCEWLLNIYDFFIIFVGTELIHYTI